jgi:polyhydroxyalkanoate synthesis repressor PhaR
MRELHQNHDPLLIKRYAKRRLYNTATAAYMSLDDLADLIRRGGRFVVREAETGEDITQTILDRLH